MNPRKCLLLFLVGLSVLIEANGLLKCYSCNELSNTNCRYLYTGHVDVSECQPKEVCVVQRSIARSGVPSTISRGCAFEGYCRLVEELTDRCETCTEDYCNS